LNAVTRSVLKLRSNMYSVIKSVHNEEKHTLFILFFYRIHSIHLVILNMLHTQNHGKKYFLSKLFEMLNKILKKQSNETLTHNLHKN